MLYACFPLVDGQAYAWPFSVFTPNRFLALVLPNLKRSGLHTPIVVWNPLVGWLRTRSPHGRLQAKPEQLFFSVILVMHSKSYIEMTDRCDFGGKPSKWRWGQLLSQKNSEFC